MQIILNRKIDLSNYQPTDLIFETSFCEMANIQCENLSGGSITVSGKLVGASDYTTLALIDNASFDLVSSISTNGLYSVDIVGIDSMKVDINGATAGTISVKVVK